MLPAGVGTGYEEKTLGDFGDVDRIAVCFSFYGFVLGSGLGVCPSAPGDGAPFGLPRPRTVHFHGYGRR